MLRAAVLVALILGLANGAARGQQAPAPVNNPAVSGGGAASQQPPPSLGEGKSSEKQPGAADSSKTTNKDERGTEAAPLSVKLLNTGKSAEEAAEETRRIKQQTADERWVSNWTIGLTSALAFATLLQFCALLWQARRLRQAVIATNDVAEQTRVAAEAAVKAANIAEKDLTITQRAFVFVKEVSVDISRGPRRVGAFGPAAPGPIRAWHVSPVWENSGTTPAQKMIMNFAAKDFDGAMPETFVFEESATPTRGFLGPKAIMHGRRESFRVELFNALTEGKRHLYVWGWADYNDVFESTPRHRTEFCFEVLISPDQGDGENYVSFQLHNRHNGADNQCSRPPAPYTERV